MWVAAQSTKKALSRWSSAKFAIVIAFYELLQSSLLTDWFNNVPLLTFSRTLNRQFYGQLDFAYRRWSMSRIHVDFYSPLGTNRCRNFTNELTIWRNIFKFSGSRSVNSHIVVWVHLVYFKTKTDWYCCEQRSIAAFHTPTPRLTFCFVRRFWETSTADDELTRLAIIVTTA